jgi:hypothetical protein
VLHTTIYIIKEFVQPKMSLNREFLSGKREGGCERERGGWASRSALFKV